MKKFLIIMIIVLLCATLCSCGNRAWVSESVKNEFYYVVINEGDQIVLHKVSKWADYESDALYVETSCCHNRIVTSYNKATLYKEKPTYLNLLSITECD